MDVKGRDGADLLPTNPLPTIRQAVETAALEEVAKGKLKPVEYSDWIEKHVWGLLEPSLN